MSVYSITWHENKTSLFISFLLCVACFQKIQLFRTYLGGCRHLVRGQRSGDGTVLLSVPVWMIVGLGPTMLAVVAGGVAWIIIPLFFLSLSLWETVRYIKQSCTKGPLNPKQPTNQRCLRPVMHLREAVLSTMNG